MVNHALRKPCLARLQAILRVQIVWIGLPFELDTVNHQHDGQNAEFSENNMNELIGLLTVIGTTIYVFQLFLHDDPFPKRIASALLVAVSYVAICVGAYATLWVFGVFLQAFTD